MTQASDIGAQVTSLVDREIAAYDRTRQGAELLLAEFAKYRVRPREITVNFSGGITLKCWTVTRSNGAYSVVYLPSAGYFSLCVDSDFGPMDIAVHGPALDVFAAV